LKFGSSVLRSPRDLVTAVHEIYRELREARRVVAVVSAFEGATDRLIDSAREIAGDPDESALALLASTGESQTVALLAIALERAGVRAIAFDAHRAGIEARGASLDADPCGLDVGAIERALDRGFVAVLPGFVARDAGGATALLGRGGSDLSALFVAHRLNAHVCRLLKDVDGVYDRDPVTSGELARRFALLDLADTRAIGGRVVQPKALRFAAEFGVEFEVASPGSSACTRVGAGASELVAARETLRPLRIGVLGLGTVGLGVYRELARDPDRFDVRRVLVRRRRRVAGIPPRILTTSVDDVLDAGCDVIVEVLGGLELASSAIERALDRGLAVVTANKAAVALNGERWREIASARGARFLFSAAVGGAVPMLEVVQRLARERRIVSIEGILNATTNFVLDLVAGGLEIEAAVARARELGYCEADPRTDLDGTDAAHKLELLARAAFGTSTSLCWLERGGIDELSQVHVRVAEAAGRRVRLVAACTRSASDADLRVAPRRLDADHPLASVRGTGNAIVIVVEDGEPIVLTGLGAGRWPTTESVIGDLLELSRLAPRAERMGSTRTSERVLGRASEEESR
jgi:homoserine dehydrogenase